MVSIDDKVGGLSRRQALLLIAGAAGAYGIGCSSQDGQGISFTLPTVSVPDELKAAETTPKAILFFRVGGKYLGTLRYNQGEDEPVYNIATLTQAGIGFDSEVDKYFAIREEPYEGKAGKFVVKPSKLGKDDTLKVPSKKRQDRQWICYVMEKPVGEDDKSYVAGFGKNP